MLLILIFIFFLGLIVGSFLNCLIWRLYKEESILGRSYCPKCRKTIHWYDNIPIISFILLKGHCRFCEKKISWQYPLVEFFTGVFFVLAFYLNLSSGFSIFKLFLDFFLISLIIIVFIFDLRWFLIPVKILLFGSILFLLFNFFSGVNIISLLWSFLIGAGFFGLQYVIGRGKWIGEGDVWLGGFLGLVFASTEKMILLLLLTYIIGGLSGIILIILGKKEMGSKVPLGVFLSLATILTLFFSDFFINLSFGLVF